jgi:hypothetical protein
VAKWSAQEKPGLQFSIVRQLGKLLIKLTSAQKEEIKPKLLATQELILNVLS